MSAERGMWIPPGVGDNLSFHREVTVPIELGETSITELVIAEPHGPCPGVLATWRDAKESLQIINGREPVFIHEPLVHNQKANEWFVRNGMVVIQDRLPNGDWDFGPFPYGGVYWISAHSSIRPRDALRAMAKGGLVQDFACILLDAEQNLMQKEIDDDMNVIFYGKKGHAETRAATALIPPGRGGYVSSVEDLKNLQFDPTKRTALHNQTTQSTWEIRKLREETKQVIPLIEIKGRGDGCNATDIRQDAVVALREDVDAMLVVSDGISNNGTNLVVRSGEERKDGTRIPAGLIHGVEDLDLHNRFPPDSGIRRLGLSSAASTDEFDFELVVDLIRQYGVNISNQQTDVREKAPYPTPRNNKHLLYHRYGLRLPEHANT